MTYPTFTGQAPTLLGSGCAVIAQSKTPRGVLGACIPTWLGRTALAGGRRVEIRTRASGANPDGEF